MIENTMHKHYKMLTNNLVCPKNAIIKWMLCGAFALFVLEFPKNAYIA